MTGIDPADRRAWSGSTYCIAEALRHHVGEVDLLGPVNIPFGLDRLLHLVARIVHTLFGTEYEGGRSILLSRFYASAFERRMRGRHYDLICAPSATVELAYLKTHIPVILIADSTFRQLISYYAADYQKLSRISRWEGNRIERRSLKKSRLAFFYSQWAAASAAADYKVDPSRVAVFPPGANLNARPEADIITRKFANPRLTLLFLGSDWVRKGGDIAFQALTELRQVHGEDARLIVCGCQPPDGVEHPDMEVVSSPGGNFDEEQLRLADLLSTVHFLIIPTRADASLPEASQANAYGVPAITTETGGVPDVVQDGVNGYCLPYHADGRLYALLIFELFKDQERYEQLVQSSRVRYEERLNWDSWAESFLEAASASFPELIVAPQPVDA